MSASPSDVSSPYDLLNPAVQADPFPLYDRMRAEDPIHWHPQFNAWILTRYADVKALMADPRIGAWRPDNNTLPSLPEDLQTKWVDITNFTALWVLRLNPPDHRRVRHLLNVGFKPRVVENLRPRIQAIVDNLLDAVQTGGQLEFMSDFAYPLPAMVIGELLGLSPQDWPMLRGWSQKIIKFFHITNRPEREPIENLHEAIAEMYDHLGALIADRRRTPRDDMLSGLIAAEEQGAGLGEAELLSTCALLLFAGHETTMRLLGNGLLALLHHPDQYQLLVQDPALAPKAVEELLRYNAAVPFIWRTALVDLEVEGRQIRAGQRILFCLAAANRDPAQFPDPGRLDLQRPNASANVAFGQGIHFCLGAPLARLEAQIAFATLPRRLPGLRQASEPVASRLSSAGRSLDALPVSFDTIE